MYRDFSENSKQKLLGLVSEVENEKWCNFTDWVGDRWYDFEVIIGELNIKNYLNKVNEYHKKVIDKNNATQSSINAIFDKVNSVDASYKDAFLRVESLLKQWQKYMDEMCRIVNPQNGKFDTKYISYTLRQSLLVIAKTDVSEETSKSAEELTRDAIKGGSIFFKVLSEYFKEKNKHKSNDLQDISKHKSNDLRLTSSFMSYAGSLYTFCTGDYDDASDIITGGLKLTKGSTSMWNGIYKYCENSLKTLDASRFGKKYQSKVGLVSLVGSICGFTSDAINTFKTLVNEDSEGYEKISTLLKNISSGADVAKSVVNLKWGQKVLTRDVHAKYQWGVASKNVANVDKANTIISVLDVVVDTGVGAVNKYGEVSADGVVDSGDFGEIGVSGSVHGLTSVVSGLTFGVSDALGLSDRADEISDNIIEFADTKGADFVRTHNYSSQYVKDNQFLMDYANNEKNNIVFRIGASAIAGAGMIEAIAVDGVTEGCSWIGNKISDGWNAIKNWL